jgi:hypothetical protein
MSEIPANLMSMLEDRVREQIAAEVRGDVSALYEFTLPAIRARRIAERNDEPEPSLSEISKFVSQVHSAYVRSINVEQFHASVQRFHGCAAAVVVTRVQYNEGKHESDFRCIWVFDQGTWFTTALGKIRFSANDRSPGDRT